MSEPPPAETEEEEVAKVPITWTSVVNSNDLVSDFVAALASDSHSQGNTGDFNSDYKRISEHHNVVPCPFVKVATSEDGVKSLKLIHCEIDLSSWRTMLLALVSCETPVTELVFHGSHLSDEHLFSFKAAMERRPYVVTVCKMAYCSFEGPRINEGLGAALGSSVGYISLKGSQLPARFLSAYESNDVCASNVSLQVLDLSSTCVTDADVSALFNGLYLNVGLKTLALRNNNCNGECLDTLARLITGRVATSEDAAVSLKAVQKAVGERNKLNKDLAKARKAAGLPDLTDVSAPDSRLFKLGAEGWIVNRGIATVDLSGNPLTAESIAAFARLVAAQQPAVSADKANGAIHTAVVMRELSPPLSEADKKAVRAIDLKGITLTL